MTDTADTAVDDPAATPQEGETVDTFDPDRAKAKITKANQEAAALRKRLKDAEARLARLDEIEDAQKTEAEKMTERLSQAERQAQEAEQRALRLEVAADKGLTPAQAKRLVGTTRDELEADAEELIATFTPAEEPTKPVPPGKPTERLVPGANPTEDLSLNGDPLLSALKTKLDLV